MMYKILSYRNVCIYVNLDEFGIFKRTSKYYNYHPSGVSGVWPGGGGGGGGWGSRHRRKLRNS